MQLVKKLSQQELLKAVKSSLSITREELCDRIGCTRRQLDSWLLPESSKQQRQMNVASRKAAEALYDEAVHREFALQNGSRVLLTSEDADFFVSPTSGNKFPRPFRVRSPGQTYIGNGPEDDSEYSPENYRANDGYFTWFTTSVSRVAKKDIFGRKITVLPCSSMSDPLDRGYIKIIAAQNESEIEGIISALSILPESLRGHTDYSEVETEYGKFVVVFSRGNTHPCFERMIIYTGRYINVGPFGAEQDWETVCITPDGAFEDDFFVRELVKLDPAKDPDYIKTATDRAAIERSDASTSHAEFLERLKVMPGLDEMMKDRQLDPD